MIKTAKIHYAFLLFIGISLSPFLQAATALSAWNNTPTKERLIDFVNKITNKHSQSFKPVADRIAVFDNDGTLWAEKPVYFQVMFAMHKLKRMAIDKPALYKTYPYSVFLNFDKEKIEKISKDDLGKVIAMTHSDISITAFQTEVKVWLAQQQHPSMHCRYTDLVYLPMLQLIQYLKKNKFKIYIVTGGGTDFVRSFATEIYGIPPEQVIGSRSETKMVKQNERYQLIKQAKIKVLNDKQQKAISIGQYIGKEPLIAVGNSDGDLAMLAYTAQNKTSLPIIVWHTDAKREFAYDKKSIIGKLDKALTMAKKNKWLIVNMKKDWQTIFANSSCKP